jgi:iron complex outermembrane receptor protein
MVRGGASTASSEAPGGRREYQGVHLVGRHTLIGADGSRTQFQAYADRLTLERNAGFADTLDTFDLDFQRLSAPMGNHLLLWGGGWRHQRDDATNTPLLQLVPARRNLTLANVFVQDEWAVRNFKLTLGLKAEHNTYTGLELLPNVRAAWDAADRQLLWAGWSRVVRTPARIDRDASAGPLQPSPNFDSEVARITELGYRGQVLGTAALSATLFHHDFERLRSVDAVPGGFTFNNNYRGSLKGVEAWAELKPTRSWRVQAGVVHQKANYSPVAGTAPLPLAPGNDPRTRYNLQSFWEFGRGIELYLGLRHIGALPQPATPSYTALDLRVGWQASRELEVALMLRNLNGSHSEWGNTAGAAEFRRSATLQAVWRH